MLAIFEPEQDGASVIIWEAGEGVRVIYPTEEIATKSAEWLLQKANEFHRSKSICGTDAIIAYSEPMSSWQFCRRFLSLAKSAGYEVKEGLQRPAKEFW